MLSSLVGALELSSQYPDKGRLHDYPRMLLAVDLVHIVENYLEITATSTKSGLYESLLEMVLEFATGKRVNAVHELARKAIKTVKSGVLPW